MTSSTSDKISLVMLALRERRLRGEIAADAAISTKQMARISDEIGAPVSEATFRRIEHVAILKLRLALQSSPSKS